MKRLNIFLKSNSLLRDALYGIPPNASIGWGGINSLFREFEWGVTARVQHETCAGFYAAAHAPIVIPNDILEYSQVFDYFSPNYQYSASIYNTKADAFIVSMQTDITARFAVHAASGHRFLLNKVRDWQGDAALWARCAFHSLPPLTADETMSQLRCLVRRLQDATDAPVLVANVSSIIPGDSVHAYAGLPETLSQRVRSFNHALVETAHELDISIVDIDRIVGWHGAKRMLIDPLHLTAEGCRYVAMEVVRILEDRGVVVPA